MLKLTNTLSGVVELFKPIKEKNVKLYVCGITPYDYAHVGHGRAYVTFDLLYRLLTFLGYTVTYCRNYTDIDDKIIRKAEQELGDRSKYAQITKKYIDAYQRDMEALNCLPPDYEPRVTDHLDPIISFIESLVASGHAYVVDGDVYFAIESFPEYGKLAKHRLEDLKAGERVQVSDKKRDPLDFALWKAEPTGQFWKSPWGYGRPGWHIECSVLASTCLGPELDIHGGGMDLIFPHHENEIAQSESFHQKPFARFWVHNGFVQINKEKMSKSLGNFFTLQNLFKQFDPMVVRYYYLTHQYRTPLDFSFEGLESVKKSYQRLCKLFAQSRCPELSRQEIMTSATVQKMLNFLEDDLNTPGMLGVVFENFDLLQQDEKERCAVKAFMQQVLGLTLEPLKEKEVTITPEIQKLVDAREQARADKDWKQADKLRDQLVELGYEVQDKKVK